MRLFNFVYSFRLVYSATKFYTWISVFPAIVGSIFPLVTVYLLKLIVDETIAAAASPDKAEAFTNVLLLIIIAGLCFFINHLSNSFDAYVKEVREQKFFDYIYERIQEKTTSIHVEYFDDDKYYDLFSRTLENAQSKPLYIVNNTISVIQNTLALLSLAILLFSLHSAVFFVLLLATVPLGIVKLKFSKALYKWVKKNTQKSRKAWDINDILTREEFALEVRLFLLKDYLIQLYKRLRKDIREGFISIYRKKMFFEIAAQLLAAMAVFSAFGIISYNTVIGILTVGSLTMYLVALERGVNFFNLIFRDLSDIYADSLYIEYMHNFLEIPVAGRDVQEVLDFPVPMKKGIEFKNVSFKYPSSQRHVLNNLNISIKAGTTVALVGVNGAGKTTIIKLLCKFYKPDTGEILVDGVDLKRIKTDSIRKNISALFQEFAQYNFSAKENITFGDCGIDKGMDKIINASRKARVHELINDLPLGYNTILGKIYNESEELSLGEWQKIGLARMYYKDSQIIVLDEPTSSMDPEAEFNVFKKFKEVVEGKTGILVSHRFSTVQMADYIYVISNERIIEEGTHQDLLHKNGTYAKMFQKQAMYYK